MTDPVTTAATATTSEIIKGMSAGVPPATREEFEETLKALALKHPEWKLDDPAMLRVLRTSIVDGWSRGQEKLLEQTIPLMVEKVNLANIDLNQKDWQAKVDKEAAKADQIYQFWLQSNLTKQKADLDANSVGMSTYEKGAAGWASIAAFFVAVIDSFQQGSLEPMRSFIADARAPKNAEIHARDVADIGNKYGLQNPKMNGAVSVEEAVEAGQSKNPLKTITSSSADYSSPALLENEVAVGKHEIIIKQNTSDINEKSINKQENKPIIFGYPAPKPQ